MRHVVFVSLLMATSFRLLHKNERRWRVRAEDVQFYCTYSTVPMSGTGTDHRLGGAMIGVRYA